MVAGNAIEFPKGLTRAAGNPLPQFPAAKKTLRMVDRKQGVMAIKFSKGVIRGAGTFKEAAENGGFSSWLYEQHLAVEASIVTATSAAFGAAIGALEGIFWYDVSFSGIYDATKAKMEKAAGKSVECSLWNDVLLDTPPCSFDPSPDSAEFISQASEYLKQANAIYGDPWVQARNFAIITGVNACIYCVMRRIRGKEDVQSSMVAAFGSGVLYSLISGLGGPNQATNAVISGLFFALVQGGIWRVTIGQKLSQPPTEDVKTKSRKSNLGMQNYKKNFMKDVLTSITLPLLTYNALRFVNIPQRPRPFLDNIQWKNLDQLLYPRTSFLRVKLRNLIYDVKCRKEFWGFKMAIAVKLVLKLFARCGYDDWVATSFGFVILPALDFMEIFRLEDSLYEEYFNSLFKTLEFSR